MNKLFLISLRFFIKKAKITLCNLKFLTGLTICVLPGLANGVIAQSFSPPNNFGTGNTPLSVAASDLNKDGNLDLAVANWNASTISILLGDGSGAFGPKTDYATGPGPRSVVVGDLNRDGKPDLVTPNLGGASPGSISVFLGNGDGSFSPKTDYGSGLFLRAAALGDLDGDGDLDIAFANNAPVSIGVMLGDGNGSFGPPASYGSASGPQSIAIGDLNQDGHLDLVTANGTFPDHMTVSVFLGDGTGAFGSFTNFTTGDAPRSVALGDLNLDGALDIVTSSITNNTVSVLLGDGNGSFGPNTDFPVTGNTSLSVAIGDLNDDGKPDLAVTNERPSPSVSVLPGDGTGNFGPQSDFVTDNFPQHVTTGDVNNDGKLDLITANLDGGFDGTVSILLNTTIFCSSGTYAAAVDYAVGDSPRKVAVGDLNGDGKPDLVVANLGPGLPTGSLSVFLGSGNGSFGAKTDFGTGLHPVDVALGDLDGDGDLDVAFTNNNPVSIGVMFGDGAGNFGSQASYGSASGPNAMAIGDLNRDGKLDLVTANGTFPDHTTVSVFLGDGTGAFGSFTNFTTGDNPRSVALGDVNLDGALDIVTSSITNNTVSVLLGDGNGSFGPNTDFPVTGNTSQSVAIGDLNGDGKPDLAVTNERPNFLVSVLLGDGTGNFGPKTDFETGPFPQYVAIGDLNSDGNLDLITTNLSSATVSVLLGDGSGSFAAPTNYGTGTASLSVAMGDFNLDGKPDLATPNYYSDNISVLLNNCVSSSPPPIADAGPDKMISAGSSTTIGGSPTASGGLGGPYTISWTPNDGSLNNPSAANPTASPNTTTTYTVTVTEISTGLMASDQVTVTVTALPALSISDASVLEGNAGTVDAIFTVSLSAASSQTVTVDYATANGAATAGSDYITGSGTVTFPANTTTPQTITVLINGDTEVEPDENFFVNLSNPVNATLADAQGLGTITNDDVSSAQWTQQTSGTTNHLRAVHFADANNGWTVGFSNTILRTTNGGVNWSPQNPNNSQPQNYLAARAIDPNIVWAGAGLAVSRTTDAGATWNSTEYNSTPTLFRNSLFPVSSTVAWAPANDTGVRLFLRYTVQPDGITLVQQSFGVIASSAVLRDIYFIDQDNGWSVGSPGQIVRITNAGGGSPSFANQTSGTTAQLNAIHMLDASTGWIAGNGGVILKTTNGGGNWMALTSGTTTNLNDIHFADLNNGWVVGENGLIRATSDGGNSWTPETSGVSTILRSVFFAGSGYAVGDNGVILKRTTGGGNTSTVAFTTAASSVAENVSPATVTVTLTTSDGNPSNAEVMVDYAASDGTAFAGNDYDLSSGTLTFPAGSPSGSTQTIAVSIFDDSVDEPSETFAITLSNPVGGSLGAPNTHTVTITDDDPTPLININDVTVIEGSSGTVKAVFTVTQSAASSQVVTVNYGTADGTAIAGSDYVTVSGTLTFPAGSFSPRTISVPVIGDLVNEPNENFFVNLSNPTNAMIGDGQGEGTINDDYVAGGGDFWTSKAAMLTGRHALAAAAANGIVYAIGGGGNGGGTPIVQAYDPATNTWSNKASMSTSRHGLAAAAVNGKIYALSGWDGNSNLINTTTVEEYDPAANSWSFKASMLTGRRNFAAAVVNGKIYAFGGCDPACNQLASVEEYDLAANTWTSKAAMPTARDGAAAAAFGGKIYVIGGRPANGNYLSIVEIYDPGTNTWTTGTSMPTARSYHTAVALNNRIYAIGGFSGQNGVSLNNVEEYNPATNTWLSRAPMPTSRYHFAAAEANGKIYAVGGVNQLTTNEEYTPAPSLSINDVTVTEGNAGTIDAQFTVTLSTASTQVVTVNYATADGSATAGSDYVSGSGTVTFPIGTTTQPLAITVNGDLLVEPDENFFVNLSTPTNATIADAQGIATITNDDVATPSISINDATVIEGNSGTVNANFTITLSSASNQIVTVNYNTADGTATAGSDYATGSGTVTFPIGITTQPLTITVNSDLFDEPDETFLVNLTNPTNATLADAQGLGTITDDDSPAQTITLNPTDDAFVNGNQPTTNFGTQTTLRIKQSAPINNSYLKFVVSGVSGPVMSAKVRLQVTVASSSGGSVFAVSNNLQTGSPWTELNVNFNNAPIISGTPLDTKGSVTVGQVVEFDVTSAITGNGTFSFGLNNASTTAVQYSSKEGATKPELVIQTGATFPSLSINDVTITEGNSGNVNASFTVSLSAASPQVVTVAYATANGTATAGSDYVSSSGIVTFPIGVTTQPVTVAVIGDVVIESNETFFVNLSNSTNAAIADAQGQGTITDDDAVTITLNPTDDAYVNANQSTTNFGTQTTLRMKQSSPIVNSYMKFAVSGVSGTVLSAKLRLKVTVASSSGGSVFAVSNNLQTGSPWTELNVNFSNAPTISGTPLDTEGAVVVNQVVEFDVTPAITGNGTFSFGLNNASTTTVQYSSKEGATKPELVIQTGPAIPSLSINDVTVAEGNVPQGGMNANFTVSLAAASTQVVTVAYATANGTATSGSDYVSNSGTVTFPIGTTTQPVTVAIIGDAVIEPNETFFVNLSNATNATIADAQGQGTITDDDAITITLNPTDDAFVRSDQAGTNFGTQTTLRMKQSSPIVNSYLKFAVSGVSGAVISAKLRLKVTVASSSGGSVFSVSNNLQTGSPWTELNVNYGNAPVISGTPLDTEGSVTVNQVVELDVTPAITGNGTFSFGLNNASTTMVQYSSKEGATKPELVIQFSASAAAKIVANSAEVVAAPPERFSLSPNYPNPFNAQTVIEYALPEAAPVRLVIYNFLGQPVRTLVDENQSAGYKRVVWNGQNEFGVEAASGVYFLQLNAGQQKFVRKMFLQK